LGWKLVRKQGYFEVWQRMRTNCREYSNEEVLMTLHVLVEGWCDRRDFKALRNILKGYPLSSPLTDGWAELLDALESVRAFASDE